MLMGASVMMWLVKQVKHSAHEQTVSDSLYVSVAVLRIVKAF